ncbi:hypothetical protein BDK51DRAFT_31733, partial [Blyttiomyces helicus]
CRFFPNHALVRFRDVDCANRALEDLATTNLFANYSTKGSKSASGSGGGGGRSGGRRSGSASSASSAMASAAGPATSGGAEHGADAGSEGVGVSPSNQPKKTIHVTNLDSDKANLLETFTRYEGFRRVAFYADYAFVIFQDIRTASKAIEEILFKTKMKANFAKAEFIPYPLAASAIGQVNSIIRVSDYPANTSDYDLCAIFEQYGGFLDVHFYHASCLVYYRDVGAARRALEGLNAVTNFTAIYSKKGLGGGAGKGRGGGGGRAVAAAPPPASKPVPPPPEAEAVNTPPPPQQQQQPLAAVIAAPPPPSAPADRRSSSSSASCSSVSSSTSSTSSAPSSAPSRFVADPSPTPPPAPPPPPSEQQQQQQIPQSSSPTPDPPSPLAPIHKFQYPTHQLQQQQQQQQQLGPSMFIQPDMVNEHPMTGSFFSAAVSQGFDSASLPPHAPGLRLPQQQHHDQQHHHHQQHLHHHQQHQHQHHHPHHHHQHPLPPDDPAETDVRARLRGVKAALDLAALNPLRAPPRG